MSDKEHKPYVPDDSTMSEFTVRALLLGLVMCVVLGAANAYLGLRAGMTIAATYPAAVIGMAVLRMMKGSLLEENFARTVGSIGESVAAGAIFTIPAFVILQIWSFKTFDLKEYLTASALMIVGGILGVLFVTILRRVMVEDRSLPVPGVGGRLRDPQGRPVEKELGLPREKTNVNGGAIAVGHPLAASGARITLHLLYELKRRGARYGIGSACIGGGQGIAVLVEAL